jgi:hypothetical protein
MKFFFITSCVFCLVFILSIQFVFSNEATSSQVSCHEESGICVNFPTLKLPIQITRNINDNIKGTLRLISAGMRRKSGAYMYKVGIYASPEKEEDLKVANGVMSGIKRGGANLVDIIRSIPESDALSIVLVFQFTMDISRDAIIEELFSTLRIPLSPSKEDEWYNQALTDLEAALTDEIGENGLKEGEEVEFLYHGKESNLLGVTVRGKYLGTITDPRLRKHVIRSYISERGLTPDVYKTLKQYFLA